MEILVATNSQGKMKEISEIFSDSKFEILFRKDLNDKNAREMEIEENANSFEGNSLIKAKTLGDITGIVTLADDSGLCVDALGGVPGINSARYSGGDDSDNNKKLLEEMKGIPEKQRNAHYMCAVTMYDPKDHWLKTVFGKWDGRIAFEPRGNKSFGYAPIFLCKDYDYKKTNAEFDSKENIKINHRGKAFKKAREILEERYYPRQPTLQS